MTTTSPEEREEKKLKDVAREYEEKGYDVLIHPSSDHLPDFLHGFEPDMVASSDFENLVIEVKSSTTLGSSSYLSSLADAIAQQPKWRLDLVVTNPRKSEEPKEPRTILTSHQIHQRIEHVKELINAGRRDAGFLLLWSAAEAALRSLATKGSIRYEHETAAYMLKKAFSMGYLSRGDFSSLSDALALRNTISHGFAISDLEQQSPELASKAAAAVLALLSVSA